MDVQEHRPQISGCPDSQKSSFTYAYNAAYKLASETYPSGRKMETEYDDAGRSKYLKGTNGATITYYAGNPNTSLIQYASHGALSSLPMANGVTETWSYNSRLQPTKIQAGSLLSILNCYQSSDDASDCGSLPVQGNNGDVQRQKITRGGQAWVQNFTYDALNRLSTAQETTANVWTQNYGYDQYGNRWLASGLQLVTLTPTSQSTFNGATNRLVGTNNYDSRGNQTSYGSFTLTYDGDDKLQYATSSSIATKYEYDGEGRRVRAHSCSGPSACEPGTGSSPTVFAYDAFGKLAMEYRPGSSTTGTTYYTQDHLGSTRLVTDASGAQTKCSDYLPFGEEIPSGATYGNRTTCFGTDDNKIKFIGKERDAETGLDFFSARYFSGAQGRWTSPDWSAIPQPIPYADLENPQSLNLYAYLRNNPLNSTDPDGHGDRLQKVLNFLGGNGWKTNKEVVDYRRQWMIDHVKTDEDKARLRDASPDDINRTWSYVTNEQYRNEQNRIWEAAGYIPGGMSYKPNPKHGPTQRGNISAEPKNGPGKSIIHGHPLFD
jgi:RHS repeat-associated protein